MAYEDSVEDGWALVIRELLRRLHGRADRRVAAAIVIALDLECGYKPVEIRARHALTGEEYKRAHRWVKEELQGMREENGRPVAV